MKCPECGGTGGVDCYRCGGKGYERRGFLGVIKKDCPQCGGTGAHHCPACLVMAGHVSKKKEK